MPAGCGGPGTEPIMEPKDPGYADRVRRIVEDGNFTRALGLSLETVGPGHCTTGLVVRPDHWQQDGYVHAGVQATLADHTAGSAAYTLVAADELVLTVEFKINLLRPAVGRRLRCRADVLRAGRAIVVGESAVYVADDAGERMCAKAMVTLAVTSAPG